MKKLILMAVAAIALMTTAAHACPSAPFDAADEDGNKVATIQGGTIMDGGWEVYSTGPNEDGYRITRYRKTNGSYTYALWKFEAINGQQPGLIWGVWKDAGMFEAFTNIYKIQTNVRGFGSVSNLTKNADGSYQVNCR